MFHPSIRPLLLGAALLTLATPGQAAQPASRRACFDPKFITDWRPVDARTVLALSGGGGYRIRTTAVCQNLTDRLAQVSTVVRSGGEVCGLGDADLYVSSPGRAVAIPCYIESVTRITPAEVKALEAAAPAKG